MTAVSDKIDSNPSRPIATTLPAGARAGEPRWLARLFLALGLALAALTTAGFLATRYPDQPTVLALLLAVLALANAAIVALILVRLRREWLEPLARLRDWARRVRDGDLMARLTLPHNSEFADLAPDLNDLGDKLKTLSLEKDERTRAQTVRLARKTQSLDVLYGVASSLGKPGGLDRLLESFLDTFIELVDARAATVRLLTENNQTRLVASRGLDPAVVEKDQLRDAGLCLCGWAATQGGLRVQRGTPVCARLLGTPLLPHDCVEFVVVPIQYQDRILGVYNLFLGRPLSTLGEDIRDLLISIGRHLGLAIEKARLDQDTRRLAIMEERNTLGNELHDSLAQALVGMRLQVKMLGESLHKNDLRAAQNEARRLREAVEEAHTSLRELLANFRLKIDDRGLVPAIRNMVQRFREETGIEVFFQNECPELRLTPAQEIQVFYIVQEALANIRKHSRARNVRVLLNSEGDLYTVLIEDDGLGMSTSHNGLPGEHMGLAVMHERARRLPGELVIESESGEGMRVVLIFTAPPPPVKSQAAGG
jgi:two-component system nitrate/nitrite sensor histidine kinase NarX